MGRRVSYEVARASHTTHRESTSIRCAGPDPEEEAQLLARTETPLAHRMLYGVLSREGMRLSEAIGDHDPKHLRDPLIWERINLKRGTITVTDHKTSEERTWVMDPSTTRALTKWKKLTPSKPHDIVFPGVDTRGIAKRLRSHLKLAAVERRELFESTTTRRQMRVHDLRGTFVTLALANGKSEAWVMDRTGHNDSQMVNLYRRASRTAQEAELGNLLPLDEAIPELRDRSPTTDATSPTEASTPAEQSPSPAPLAAPTSNASSNDEGIKAMSTSELSVPVKSAPQTTLDESIVNEPTAEPPTPSATSSSATTKGAGESEASPDTTPERVAETEATGGSGEGAGGESHTRSAYNPDSGDVGVPPKQLSQGNPWWFR